MRTYLSSVAVASLVAALGGPLCGAGPDIVVNSVGMKLVRLEPGEFLMGSPEDEEDRGDDELQHRVRITRAFRIGQHEVTVGQFAKFVAATNYRTAKELGGQTGFGFDAAQNSIEIKPEYTWRNNHLGQTDEHPVINLVWDDAVAFCRWLSESEKRTYRLPTEAEWEYACRAGTKTAFWTGATEETLKGNVNLADLAFKSKYLTVSWNVEWNDGQAFTAPVGSFRPNAWGLYDMTGNVWEWCQDWYAADYYRQSAAQQPHADPPGPEKGTVHVVRGGSFTNRGRLYRSADRDATRPKYRYNFIGFRVVRAE